MKNQLLHIGNRFINLANVSYIQVVEREVGNVVQIFTPEDGNRPHISLSGEEGKALQTWLENSTLQVFPAEEDDIPIAFSRN